MSTTVRVTVRKAIAVSIVKDDYYVMVQVEPVENRSGTFPHEYPMTFFGRDAQDIIKHHKTSMSSGRRAKITMMNREFEGDELTTLVGTEIQISVPNA